MGESRFGPGSRWHLVGERRALSMLFASLLTTFFALIALAQPDWRWCFGTMAVVYGTIVFGLGGEWFWARWYTLGVAANGITMTLLGLLLHGWNDGLAIWGGIHLLIYLPLMGRAVGERYENKPVWQEKFGISDMGVSKLQRAVKGAASSLPTLVMYALAPRETGEAIAVLFVLGVVGMWGLLRMRFWGVLLLGMSAILVGVSLLSRMDLLHFQDFFFSGSSSELQTFLTLGGAFSAAMLAFAVTPFLLPVARFWKSLSSKVIR